MPHAGLFLHSGLFFVFGYYFYQHQEFLIKKYTDNCWRYFVAGLVVYMLALQTSMPDQILNEQPDHFWWLYNCASWLLSISLIGICLRYLPKQNRALRYMADSSYWAYIVHYIGVIGFAAMLYHSPFNALTRMGLNIAATTVFCLLTYHVFVRFTPIGTLLNGRRFSFKTKRPVGEEISQELPLRATS